MSNEVVISPPVVMPLLVSLPTVQAVQVQPAPVNVVDVGDDEIELPPEVVTTTELTQAIAAHVEAGNPHPQYAPIEALEGFQPLNNELTALAEVEAQDFGRELLTLPDAPTAQLVLTGNWEFRQASKPLVRPDDSDLVEGDRWFDLSNFSWWVWNGAYWLTEQLFVIPTLASLTTAASFTAAFAPPSNFNLLLVSVTVSARVSAPARAADHIVFKLESFNKGNVSFTDVASLGTTIDATTSAEVGTNVSVP
ncbi:hypothetical protein IQ268_30520, partial [Oculatella sp. LEGE 06141]|uniref:hypothetical protein n=1 Tax=Oculatella sp. LEGE 06141 TaxID=1828648 RepID=UPI001880F884